MGKSHQRKNRGPLSDAEWERERRVTKKCTKDELKTLVELSIIRPSEDGHAYSLSELKELRNILRLDNRIPDDVTLQRHTDEFAALIGSHLRIQRQLPAGKRAQEIGDYFIKPARKICDAIDDRKFRREFSRNWGHLHEINLPKLRASLSALIKAAERHVIKLRTDGGRGRSWDHGLKRKHVYTTAPLCEYLNPISSQSASAQKAKRKPLCFRRQ
jgi:hypothetical protein